MVVAGGKVVTVVEGGNVVVVVARATGVVVVADVVRGEAHHDTRRRPKRAPPRRMTGWRTESDKLRKG